MASLGTGAGDQGDPPRPVAVAVDRSGRIYIADRENIRVHVVGTDGTMTTFARQRFDRAGADRGTGH